MVQPRRHPSILALFAACAACAVCAVASPADSGAGSAVADADCAAETSSSSAQAASAGEEALFADGQAPQDAQSGLPVCPTPQPCSALSECTMTTSQCMETDLGPCCTLGSGTFCCNSGTVKLRRCLCALPGSVVGRCFAFNTERVCS